ncbi:MAG: hypothetical protein HFACDABA_01058 [Anaerolineales bacterium]|nr:hypothetical protein [Anaerolineales bacterium]
MTRRDLLILFLLGLAVNFAIAQFQSLPGYMDADYYFGGGLQLARGNGFTEPYLWNYLANPQTLPAPSHAYWLPLASLLAAAGMWLTGQTTFAAARIGFILLAALIPPLTSLLAFRVTSNRISSLLSGLLACFSIYYAPFLPVTDNYAIYMLLGATFFLLFSSLRTSPKSSNLIFFGFGLLSALASLARSDGLLWLGISFLIAIWYARNFHLLTPNSHLPLRPFIFHLSSFIFFTLIGFILIAFSWYARNLSTFGTLMAPGGIRALWLTHYNDTFIYPASQLTMQSWLASGWDAIAQARLSALGMNLLNAFGAQGGIFLFPFILIGVWQYRRDTRVRFALLAWMILLAAMTCVFPFAGPRGAFFHSGAALQPMWWVLAPLGLDAAVAYARRKNLFDDRAFVIFRGSLALIAILMTGLIFTMRVLPGWEREDGRYVKVEALLAQQNIPASAIFIVRNPPGFHVVTGRPAIAIPTGNIPAILNVAEKFNAQYLLLEPDGVSKELRGLYDHPEQFPSLLYLGETDGNRLYKILR